MFLRAWIVSTQSQNTVTEVNLMSLDMYIALSKEVCQSYSF